jgi:drug/metabolite transporter (DMT)-like permease
VLVTGADVSVSGRALLGDVLAIAGGLAAAVYVTIGASARESLTNAQYTAVCYAVCAVTLLAVCLAARVHLAGYPAGAWWKLVAVTGCAQLLGHSLINLVLRSTSPTVVGLVLLFEVPGAALVALVWLHQRPPVSAIPGIALLFVGLVLVARAGGRAVPVEATE